MDILKFIFSSFFIVGFLNGLNAQEYEFDDLLKIDWEEVFADSGTKNWEDGWFLDGQRASIKNMQDGMLYSAGPVERDNASHAVLWTKNIFEGDLKIEFDYTRMDDITKYVNIIYIQATGKGTGNYVEDITKWSDLRIIPYMNVYYRNMNLWHVSYAAFGNDDNPDKVDYLRARRYPVLPGKRFADTEVGKSFEDTGLFEPGKKYHMIFIKKGDMLYMKVEGEGVVKYYNWDFSDHPSIEKGRIGLRHMWTRCSKYANFSVSELGE
jgi:hypothetical protein